VRDGVFSIWSDIPPQLSIDQSSWSVPKGWTLLDAYSLYRPMSHIKLRCKYLGFQSIRFKFHDRIKQRPINFQSAIPGTVQVNKRLYVSWRYANLFPTSNKRPPSTQVAYFRSHARSANQHVQIRQGSWLTSLTIILFTRVALRIKSNEALDQRSTHFLLLSAHASPRTKSKWLYRYVLQIYHFINQVFKSFCSSVGIIIDGLALP
jgi:hypothetical protein